VKAMPELTVIIPTYNEALTIRNTIDKLKSVLAGIDYEILVVDDNSPDGTTNSIIEVERVRVIKRYSNPGLSQSVVDGFAACSSFVVVVTDADLSHDVSLIPVMYSHIKYGCDIVIGSRYMHGGGIENWPLKRCVISFGATFLGRLLFPKITDPVSGFFAVKRSVVVGAPLIPNGYKILLEILGKCNYSRTLEIPYTFVDRKEGTSKLKFKTMLQYLHQVINIALWKCV